MKEESGVTDSFGEESVFNMSLAILKRIDNLLTDCATANVKGDHFWRWRLLGALTLQIPKLKDEEVTYIEKLRIGMPTKLKKWGLAGKPQYLDCSLGVELDELEYCLRDCLDKRKMLMSGRDDPMHAMGRT